MFLGSLYYHLDKCVSEEPFSKIGGGTWFLQIWLFHYFPKLRSTTFAPSDDVPVGVIDGDVATGVCLWCAGKRAVRVMCRKS